MDRLIKVCLVALFVSGCGGLRPRAKVIPDYGDSATVLVTGYSDSSALLCTGVVISEHVVATAAHCLMSHLQYQIYIENIDYFDVETYFYDTAYNDDHLFAGHDIGVLITRDSLPVLPVPINHDSLKTSDINRALRIIGYGRTSPDHDDYGVKRERIVPLFSFDYKLLETIGGSICFGDSGGPVLLKKDGIDYLVGITSFSDQSCGLRNWFTRVDTYSEFLDGYIKKYG